MSASASLPILPYGRQSIDEADIAAVVQVLRSDFLTQGPAIGQFEEIVAAFCGTKYAIAVSNATAALHISALALELGPGERLWTSPNTFVASANCGLYCGAQVDFVDIDPSTYNLSPYALATKLAAAARTGTLPKVLVPVHFAGQPCEMDSIKALCSQYGVRIVADASHAIGAGYRGKIVGGDLADLTVFSFHPVKILTTGEGGMVLTNDPALHEKLLRLRSQGITRDPRLMNTPAPDPWYYEQIDLGFNYRMTDISAALGTSQMKSIHAFLSRRRALAARYDQLLAGLPLVRPKQHSDTLSSWHLYVVQPDPTLTKVTRRMLYDGLRQANIHTQVHYIPVHLQPWYRRLGFKPGDFPAAENYYSGALSLPIYYSLTDQDQDRVIDTLKALLRP